jgi:Holliday junction resolvase RusA-like endonuclease
MTFSLPIPASWSHRKAQEASLGLTLPTVAPDLDNLAKAVLDGCNGVVFEDDKQVVTLCLTKRYAQAGRVAVSFEEIRA